MGTFAFQTAKNTEILLQQANGVCDQLGTVLIDTLFMSVSCLTF